MYDRIGLPPARSAPRPSAPVLEGGTRKVGYRKVHSYTLLFLKREDLIRPANFPLEVASLPCDAHCHFIRYMSTMLATMSTTFRGTALNAASRQSTSMRPQPLTIEAAHKKGAGSTKNGRDSNSKRRGVKVYGGQPVPAGGIIIRQLGTKVHPGKNVGLGKDYTLFSLIDGVVKFEKNSKVSKVNVVPFEEYEIPAGQRLQEGSRKHKRRNASAAQ